MMRLQPRPDSLDHHFLLPRLPLWQLEQCCDFTVRGGQRLQAFCMGPQDHLVLLMIAIGILDSYPCFANATQSTDCLWLCERGSLVCLKLSIQPCQQIFTTKKEDIVRRRNIPY